MKTAADLKVLLLQIRDDKETMMEELYEFVQYSGLYEEQFTVLNTFLTSEFPADYAKDFDVVFIGGSSDASVLKPEEFLFLADCKKLLRYCYDNAIPVFASCFGFQLLVQEFGGEVILDADNLEMGTYEIYLTEAAKEDILFADLPNPFIGVSGHRERACTLPANAINLAYTPQCPFHAIKMPDKPIYGFQFHPEIDVKDLVARLDRYQQHYLEDAEAFERIKQSIHPNTSFSNVLVKKFIEKIVLKPQIETVNHLENMV